MFQDVLTLKVFEKVADLNSFSKAAKAMGFSQVMVSKRIANLEGQLGLKLFDRTAKTIRLTCDGQRLLESCKTILQTIEKEEQKYDDRNALVGTLKIIAPPFFSRYYIVPHLEAFFEKYPNIKLEIILTENKLDVMQEGAHLEIRVDHLEATKYEQKILFQNPKIICATPEYIKRFGKPKTPKELYKHNCLIFGENRYWRLTDAKHNRYDLELTGTVKCNNGEIIKELVLAGLGITLKSRQDIQHELEKGQLVDLFPDYEIENQTVVFANYPKNIFWEPHVTAFLEFLVENHSR